MHFDLDRRLSGQFYTPGKGWPIRDLQPWKALHDYGTIPGVLLAIGSLIAWLVCILNRHYLDWHRYFLLIVLTAVLGAGLIVNATLKSYWGRPRPSQIRQFQGLYDYRPFYRPGVPGKGESFPCGHCTMGFLFITLFFWRRKTPKLAYIGGTFGIVAGVTLSAGRIVQGAHYLTDTFWSLGIILLTATTLYFFILKIPLPQKQTTAVRTRFQKMILTLVVGLMMLAITVGFLTRRPNFNSFRDTFTVSPATDTIIVRVNHPIEKSEIRYKNIDYGHIIIHSHGFGWPSSKTPIRLKALNDANTAALSVEITPSGFFSELNHQVEIWLPQTSEHRIKITFETLPSPNQSAAKAGG